MEDLVSVEMTGYFSRIIQFTLSNQQRSGSKCARLTFCTGQLEVRISVQVLEAGLRKRSTVEDDSNVEDLKRVFLTAGQHCQIPSRMN